MFAVLFIADFALHAVLRTEMRPTTEPARMVAEAALAETSETAQALPFDPTAPAALFDGSKKKSLLVAANPAARAAGVELGMTAPQAIARCPHLLIRTPHPNAEREARAALLAVGFTVSPSIEDTASGVCTIDLKGIDPPRQIEFAQHAVAQLRGLGLPATAGLARTPLLAWYAARAAETANGSAAEAVLKIDGERDFLRPLPLATAEPSPTLAQVLADWGLRTLGDLTALPRDEIVRRFGAEGLALWQRASGGSPRPLHLVAPPQTFAAEMEFEEEIETLEPLLFILRRFLDRLTLELRAAHQVAVELALTLELEDETTYTRQFRLPEPTGEQEILFRALHTHLESLRTESSVSAIQLRIVPARPLVRQQGLFDTGLRDPHGFAETLARVVALVGTDRVGTPQLEDTYRPDAYKLVAPEPVIPPLGQPPVHPAIGLPLRRFRPPLPVKLELTERVPTYAWTDRFHGAIREVRGPWRSSGEWWEKDRLWSRIEWDIALAQGGLYRLVYVNDSYWIEGEYD